METEEIYKTSNKIDLNGTLYYKNDHNGIQKFRNKVRKDDIKIVDTYVGKGEPEINQYLRGTKVVSGRKRDTMEKHREVLDKLCNSYALPQDTLLFRGANHPLIAEMEEGDILEDNGFKSATENIKWTEFFINQPDAPGQYKVSNPTLIVINAKKGQHAAPLSAIKSPKQGEFLLPRDAKLQVDTAKWQGKLKILETHIVSGGHKPGNGLGKSPKHLYSSNAYIAVLKCEVDEMKTIIVTRHPGALAWIQKHHPEIGDVQIVETILSIICVIYLWRALKGSAWSAERILLLELEPERICIALIAIGRVMVHALAVENSSVPEMDTLVHVIVADQFKGDNTMDYMTISIIIFLVSAAFIAGFHAGRISLRSIAPWRKGYESIRKGSEILKEKNDNNRFITESGVKIVKRDGTEISVSKSES
ncbi:MAG: ADP-ribosyltransferase [Candidatus Gracilibacteria bacterium]|nr:ADP-ribosyltransferase [Candidatus Gracilibacteria bacterium]